MCPPLCRVSIEVTIVVILCLIFPVEEPHRRDAFRDALTNKDDPFIIPEA